MQSPIQTIEPPRSSVGEKNAALAVAILTTPENCTLIFCNTIVTMLAAALRRNSVPVIKEGALMDEIFSVAVLDVPWQLRGHALDVIKDALKEAELMDRATIAVSTAEDVWLTVYGIGEGSIDFQKVFLRPELFERMRATVENAKRISAALEETMRERLRQLKAQQAENPDPESQ